ncbi:helix-turn-helix domain-containing protein [Phaeobacter sp. JH20_02]|uniref:helix-turn-helix domain-containing protein n=1 Tax=Phaeobacter sp. JH20_02 TaxID=3112461 RepID=UPI003A89BCD5
MSHKAVSWALEQRHLKPGPWVVLIQLADRHNKDTLQCDPDQNLIAADCNMSRATVNRHLEDLETCGLIRRVPRVNPRTNKALSTFYILGLNFDNPPVVEHAVSQNETRKGVGKKENKSEGHVSKCDTEPCLKNDDSRVSKNAISESQIETQTLVKEPVKEPCAADASHHRDLNLVLDEIWAAYPRKGDQLATEEAARALIEGGANPADLLAAVKAYAKKAASYDESRVKLSQNFFAGDFWQRNVPVSAKVASRDEILQARAKTILEGKTFLCRSITAHAAGECITAGLVTPQDCLQAGIAL